MEPITEALERTLQAASGGEPSWRDDVQALHINSRERTEGDTPGRYVISLPRPIEFASTVQLGSIFLPARAIDNVGETRARVPLALPLDMPAVDLSLNLSVDFDVTYYGLPTGLYGSMASALRAGGAGELFESLVPIYTDDVSIVLPRRLNTVASAAADGDYIVVTTALAHGMDVALQSYRTLGLGVRVAGSLLNGAPNLLPPLSVCLAAGLAPDFVARPLIEVVDELTFRVRADLLALSWLPLRAADAAPPTVAQVVEALFPNNAALNDVRALTGAASALPSAGAGVYLVADMPTFTEALTIFNTAAAALHRETVSFVVPPALRSPFGASPSATVPLLPDMLRAVVLQSDTMRPPEAPPGAAIVYTPGEVTAALMRSTSTDTARDDVAAQLEGGRWLFLLPIVQLRGGVLARYMGWTSVDAGVALPTPIPLALLVNDVWPGRASGAAPGLGVQSLTDMGSSNAFKLAMAMLRRMGASEGSQLLIRLQMGLCSGDPWRRDVMTRAGRYDASECAAMITERALALTFNPTEIRSFQMLDVTPAPLDAVFPPGDYYPEYARLALQSVLRATAHDDAYTVTLLSVVPDACVAPPRTLCSLPEIGEPRIASGFPRFIKFAIAHTGGVAFGLRFEGRWARRLGFTRDVLRGSSTYVSDEWAPDAALPFEFTVRADKDAALVERFSFSAVNAINDAFHRLTVCDAFFGLAPSVTFASTAGETCNVTRLRRGDVLDCKLPASAALDGRARSFSAVGAGAFDASSHRTALLPSWSACLLAGWHKVLRTTPADASERFALLFGLTPRVSLWRLLGFAPANSPPVPALCMQQRAGTQMTPTALPRNAEMDGARGRLYAARGVGSLGLGAAVSPALQPAAGIKSNGNAVEALFALSKMRDTISVNAAIGPTPGAAAMVALALSTSLSGGGGGAVAGDSGQLQSGAQLTSAYPARVDEPRYLFLRLSVPGADVTRTRNYMTLVDGAVLAVFTKVSLARHDVAVTSEQLLHQDLTGVRDVQTIAVEWLDENMEVVTFNGCDQEFTLLFKVRTGRMGRA